MKEKVLNALNVIVELSVLASCAFGAVHILQSILGESGAVLWVGAAVGCFLAICAALSFRYAHEAERDVERYRSDAEKYERLYWEYEAKCKVLEKMAKMGEQESVELLHVAVDVPPEVGMGNLERALKAELSMTDDEQYKKYVGRMASSEWFSGVSEEEKRAAFVKYQSGRKGIYEEVKKMREQRKYREM